MRYGIVRLSPRLPDLEDQRQRLEAIGCEAVFEERAHTASGQRRLLPLLERLKAGDEVIAHSLDAFDATIGDLVRMFHRFGEAGITLTLIGEPMIVVPPEQPASQALGLLADYEAHHPSRSLTRRRVRATEPLLTTHQLKFARDMQRRGYGLREIGLLFRLSPGEITMALAGSAPTRPSSRAASEADDGHAPS